MEAVQLKTHSSLVEVSNMKPHFSELTLEQQATFGNGCTFVPDFNLGKLCRKHDWFYSIGCGANHWYENLWKAPYHKISEDIRMGYWGAKDSFDSLPFLRALPYATVSILYSIGLIVLPISWFFFTYGRWRTLEEVVKTDQGLKDRLKGRTFRSALSHLRCKLWRLLSRF